MAELKLTNQGAEARVFECDFYGKSAIKKERFSKKYRHPDLDKKLLNSQITMEVRLLNRCLLNKIPVPAVYYVDKRDHVIFMEKIEGVTVKHLLSYKINEMEIPVETLAEQVAIVLAQIHDNNVIHGDLTTSNMIYNKEKNDSNVTLIDFGLGFISDVAEDKAVDLYVFERALSSTAPNCHDFLASFYSTYTKLSKNSKSVLTRLEDVRMRGRKRDMSG
ncbi:TP53-regulating kinase [Smittium culicis]|uniref:non-specific serine/threonine protein kinase n=2 Tax=Smittium culicis TaxID=133412 RepID=A0A1R1YGR4_9FUNG|nr:TP53-regulating kinase [Smittium culicis]